MTLATITPEDDARVRTARAAMVEAGQPLPMTRRQREDAARLEFITARECGTTAGALIEWRDGLGWGM